MLKVIKETSGVKMVDKNKKTKNTKQKNIKTWNPLDLHGQKNIKTDNGRSEKKCGKFLKEKSLPLIMWNKGNSQFLSKKRRN